MGSSADDFPSAWFSVGDGDRSRSKYSGSDKEEEMFSSLRILGLLVGETKGDVCSEAGISAVVSNTKKASPPSPSFIA